MIDWPNLAAMATVGMTVAGVLFMALRGKLGNDFVGRADHDALTKRMASVEQRLETIPTHDDFKLVNASVAAVALQIATVTERVDGLRTSLTRIESTLKMFVEARLTWEAKQP